MARVKRPRCECGCGQAPASTTRQRLVECQCGLKVRMTREWIERCQLSCSCGGTLEPVCLLDRAQGGDESAWAEYMGRQTFSAMQSDRGKLGAARRRAQAACQALTSDERADRAVRSGNTAMYAAFSPGQIRAAEQRMESDAIPF